MRTREELARLLAMPVGDLLSREEAARRLGVESATLKRTKDKKPGYFRSTDKGSGGEVWYPLQWVEQHLSRTLGRADNRDYPMGPQPWPLPLERLRLFEISDRAAAWKEHKLYQLAHDHIMRQMPFCRPRHEETRQLLGRYAEGDAVAIAEINQIASYGMRAQLPLNEQWGKAARDMIVQMWSEALDQEAKWFAGDLSNVPRQPPSRR
ncbi:hypothetical protein ACO2Q0_17700 [Phenylobacterium sp. VNQ135]|uniref:hypothetical protein n=1 Tax=Phenylobacterium sp. VNQ135 TaxID=3400922 RepID=UPI003C10F08A